jgi:hypothetical protein
MTSIPNDDGAVRALMALGDVGVRGYDTGMLCEEDARTILAAIREGKVPGVTTHSIATLHEYIASEDKLRADLTALREALAAARGAMEVQDERERAAGERCGVSQMERGCDWPDAVADLVIHLRKQRDEAIASRDALSASQGVMVGVLREAKEYVPTPGTMMRLADGTVVPSTLRDRITALLPPEAL